MAATIITLEDLQAFKQDLLKEIIAVLESHQGQPRKKWLKSYEVLTMLDISKNTLQMMRSKKILKCRKVGGVYYYLTEDVQKMVVGY